MRSRTMSGVGSAMSSTTAAVGEEHDPVGVGGGHRIVGDHHDGLSHLADRLAHERQDLGARTGVEVAGRLVGEDDLRPAGQRPGHCHTLLLAAGQLRRSMAEPVAETDGVDHQVAATRCRACARQG